MGETIGHFGEPGRIVSLDFGLIEDIDFDGIHHWDYPDYVDAYIYSASYAGRAMTEEELDIVNEDRDFVYEKLMEYLY